MLLCCLNCSEQEGVEAGAVINQKARGGVLVLRLQEGEAVKMLVTETTATIGQGGMVSSSGAHGKKEVHWETKGGNDSNPSEASALS